MSQIVRLEELCTAAGSFPVGYSFLGSSLPEDMSQMVKDWRKGNLMVEDVSIPGYGDIPMFVLRHGLRDCLPPAQLEQMMGNRKPFKVVMGPMALHDQQEDHDIFYAKAGGPEMMELYEEISAACPHDDSPMMGAPYVQVSTVRKGTCDQMIGNDDLMGNSFMVNGLEWYGSDGKTTKFPMKNA